MTLGGFHGFTLLPGASVGHAKWRPPKVFSLPIRRHGGAASGNSTHWRARERRAHATMARPTIFTHPKFLMLRHLTGLSIPAAIGHLECLWHVGYQSGNPYLGNAGCVALAAHWDEHGRSGTDSPVPPRSPVPTAQDFVSALLESGFIDEVSDGKYEIHDLHEHAPEYVSRRRERENERKITKKCGECGDSFRAANSYAEYCSDQCRKSHWRKDGRGRTGTGTGTGKDGDGDGKGTAKDGTPTPTPTPTLNTPLPPKEFELTAEGLAQEFCFYSAANSRNEKDPFKATPAMRDLIKRGISPTDIQARIRDPERPKTQFLWQFVKPWEHDHQAKKTPEVSTPVIPNAEETRRNLEEARK